MKNRDLELRTKREFYDDYAGVLREHGVSSEEIERIIAKNIEEAQTMLAGKCPKCGAPLARYVDQRHQFGPSDMPGVWAQYRCSTQSPPGRPNPPGACDFMVDLKEGGEAD